MERVTGIGGFFFTAKDPGGLADWYETHLGVDPPPRSYGVASWQQQSGSTVFAPMPAGTDTTHLLDAKHPWAINFRVVDLDAMVRQLRAAAIEVVEDTETYPNGRFADLRDPEGNAIQLWQPAGADLDGR